VEIVLRPFTALALFAIAILAARVILRYVPDGPAKTLLQREYHIVPRTEAERRDSAPFWLFVAASAFLFILVDLLTWSGGGDPAFLVFLR